MVTEDIELIRSIATRDDVWIHFAEDGQNKDKYTPGTNNLFLLYKEKREIVGMCQVDIINIITLMIHPYLFNGKKHLGRDFIKKTLSWLVSNSKAKVEKVVAIIPENAKSVYNCAIKCGFKQEGFLRNQHKKNGQILNQFYMGITHREILKW